MAMQIENASRMVTVDLKQETQTTTSKGWGGERRCNSEYLSEATQSCARRGAKPQCWREEWREPASSLEAELWATPAGRNSGAALARRSEASISISIAVRYLVRRELTIQRGCGRRSRRRRKRGRRAKDFALLYILLLYKIQIQLIVLYI
jgi:hypothetical protein